MMAWSRYLLSLFFFIAGLTVCSGDVLHEPGAAAVADWNNANEAFDAGRFDKAAALYEKAAQAEPHATAVWYNLGNAEFKLHHTAAAILAYQKALHRDPALKEAAQNLKLAQSRLPGAFSAAQISWWKSPGASNAGAVLAAVFFVAMLAVVAFRRRHASFARAGLVLPLALLWLLSLGFSYYSQRKSVEPGAVVMKPVSLRNESGQEVADLPEGVTLTLPDGTRSGQTKVRLPDGRTGMLPVSALGLID